MITIAEYLQHRQPGMMTLLWFLWPAPPQILPQAEQELTEEQRRLERIMRQRPKQGRG